MPLIQVALPTPLRRLFDYWPVAGQPWPQPGVRVLVPFGRRQLVGVVMGSTDQSDIEPAKLKAALSYLDTAPLFQSADLRLLHWVARYYHHPLGEVVQLALPALLRQGQGVHPAQDPRWQLTPLGQQEELAALGRAQQQKALIEQLRAASHPMTQKALQAAGFSTAVIKALAEKGWIAPFTLPKTSLPQLAPAPGRSVLADVPLNLTAEQKQVVQAILPQLQRFHVHLIQGVTGSGKTEVYLHLIQQVLEQGRQALVLIPEIGLTPQTLARFQKRFNRTVVALHSGLNDRERLDAWRQAMEGQAAIVLGTRSAVFTPLPKLGLILIDEEHDASFKQQDSVRYHARDVAIVRAQQQQIPIILGSATPSLESLAKVEAGLYQVHYLHQRPQQQEPPQPKLLEIRSRRLEGGFSEPLLSNIQKHLDAGHQALVLLNRRGYAPVLMCSSCGWIAGCRHCDARMTWHREPARLHCHHCDHQQPIPSACPVCSHSPLLPLGSGTERAEETLQTRFPDVPIIRMDRDSVRGKTALQSKLDQIHHAGPAILLGTQMLAKGHHFPLVTLATLLDADYGLYSSDPRAIERTAQLITQVAGRAGREQEGEVIIQTYHSDDPRLIKLCAQGYAALAQDLLQERRQLSWAPYTFLALWRAESPQKEKVEAFMQALAAAAQELACADFLQLQRLGPVPAPMERRQGRYHMQFLLLAQQRSVLHQQVELLLDWCESQPLARQVRWSVDIDPEDLF